MRVHLSALLFVSLIVISHGADTVVLKNNVFFKGIVRLPTTGHTGAPLENRNFIAAPNGAYFVHNNVAEKNIQLILAEDGSTTTIPLGFDDYEVLSADPVHAAALVKRTGIGVDGQQSDVKLYMANGTTVDLLAPEASDYHFADVADQRLVVLDDGVIIALGFTDSDPHWAVALVSGGRTTVSLKEIPLGDDVWFSADGVHYTYDGDKLIAYNDTFFTTADAPTPLSYEAPKVRDPPSEFRDALDALDTVFQQPYAAHDSVGTINGPERSTLTVGSLICRTDYVVLSGKKMVGLCYENKEFGLYEIEVGGTAASGLTNLYEAAWEQKTVYATTRRAVTVLTDETVFVVAEPALELLERTTPAFTSEVRVKPRGKPIIDSYGADGCVGQKSIVGGAFYCVGYEEALLTCGIGRVYWRYSSTSKPEQLQICATIFLGATHGGVYFARQDQFTGFLSVHYQPFGSYEVTEYEVALDALISQQMLVLAYPEYQFFILRIDGVFWTLNYRTLALIPFTAVDVRESGGKIQITESRTETTERIVWLDPSSSFFSEEGAQLPASSTVYITYGETQKLYFDLLRDLYDEDYIKLQPSSDSFVPNVKDRDVSVEIRLLLKPGFSLEVRKKLKSTTVVGEEEIKQLAYVGVGIDSERRTYDLTETAIELTQFQADSGASELELQATDTACILRYVVDDKVYFQGCSLSVTSSSGPLSRGAKIAIIVICVAVAIFAICIPVYFICCKK